MNGETCQRSPDEVKQLFNSGDSHVYTLELNCPYDAATEDCGHGKACDTPGGETGTEYDVIEDGATNLGPTCLTPGDVSSLHTVTPLQVLEAARHLTWPKADLIIQPSGGETLVNLPTIFLTTTTNTVTRPVTVLGQQVTVQAWPDSYTWIFGDGDSYVSTIAGRKIRFDASGNANLDGTIHHEYRTRGTASARVDITYAGHYRLGDGQWQDLP